MAPITKHKRTYFTAVVIVVVSVVILLLFFLNPRYKLRPVYKEERAGELFYPSIDIFDHSDGSPTLPPRPTPTPQVTWNGLEKTTVECRNQTIYHIIERFEPAGWTYAAVCVFLLTVAVTLFAIGIALYFFIRSSQLNHSRAKAVSGVVLALILVLGIFGCFKFWLALRTESCVEPDSNYRHLYIHAPIVYLYDDECREATVKLDLNGELTCTYPKYDNNDGWIVKTSPDGTLTDANGRKYEYLFWEADLNMQPDTSRGFCVKNTDTAAFLEEALATLGLTDTEANTFIMYWLPVMEENPYNMIYFQTDVYENAAKLEVTPTPDTIVRVNMFFQPSDEYVEIEEQDLSSMNPSLDEREGFVVVEWGGEYLEN